MQFKFPLLLTTFLGVITIALPVKASGIDSDDDGVADAIDVDIDGNGLIEINSLEQLNNIRNNLAGTAYDDGNSEDTTGCGNNDDITACFGYELTANLSFDENDDGVENDTYNTGEGWTPIGTLAAPFTGTFDGNNFTISNLYINNTSLSGDDDSLGLFGHAENATIENLHLDGQIAASGYYVAGLVGYLYGSNPSVMTNISFKGTVTSNQGGAYTGGIAGRASQATIKQCLATVDVTGQGDAGAFAGELVNGSVENCLVNGSVITSGTVGGGFIGNLSGSGVTNVASHAKAEANNAVGGLIGSVASSSSTITNSFSTGSAKQAFNKGGLTGSALGTVTDSYWDTQASGLTTSGSGTGYTTAELQAPVANVGIYANWDQTYWDFGTSSQYPSPIINGVAFHDRDNDGVPDSLDAFPDDSTEWSDADNDNVGDNADAFPNDPTEWSDTDGDLIGDNSDPDIDGDNVVNESDLYPFDATGSTAAHDVDIDDDGLIEISTLAQLHAMRDDLAGNSLSGVTAGCAGLTDGTGCMGYELITDLDFDTDADGDLSDEDYYNTGEGWQPIGSYDDRFAANFNGNGHTISNLFISRPDEDYQALLGYVATVSVTNINIDGDLTSVTGLNNSALLIARNSSTDSAVLSNINVQGTVLGNDDSGLVAGRLYDLDADYVHAQGRITSISITDDAGSDTGGLFGQLSGSNTLDNVSFEGNIQAVTSAGGLIGDAESVTINDSYAIVDITLIDEAGIETDIEVAGGLIGKVEGTSVLTRVFAQGSITAPIILGGLIGDIDGATEIVDSYADVSLLGDSVIGGIAGDLNADSTFERVLAYGAINTNDGQNTDTGGLLGYSSSNTLSVVYALWDTEATGISSTFNSAGAGYTSEQLKCPTTPADVNCNSSAYTNDWSSTNWDFGTSEQYPALLLSGNLYRDADSDGYWAFEDAFDDDASEYLDSDNDSVGDNADAFPDDINEQYDTDGDGVGNNADDDDAGDLVTTYGLNGISSAYVHNGDREIYITDAIAHDNGLYLVGSSYHNTLNEESGVIIDVDSTGAINTDFADNGILYALYDVETHFKLALTSDSGIKVAGEKDNQVFIAQYDATGALDTRFNETGVYDNEDGLIIRGTDVASTLTNGSTVIYGKYTYQNFAHKLSSGGTFDTSFGDAGSLSIGATELGSSIYFIDALVLNDDSQVLAMKKQDGTFYLAKIDVDGNIDTSFGTDGELALDSDMFARSIKLAKDADGNVYAAGTTSNVAKRLSVLKVVDGQLDGTFADNGYSANDFDEDISIWNVQDIQIQSDGRILVLTGLTPDYAHVVRFTETGELDSQFNTVGYVRLDVQDYDPIKLIVQEDGNLLIAGSDWNGFGIHLVNMLNDYDLDGDGLTNSNDLDDDGDGVEDASDVFPLDATETLDSDNDGVGDNADAFPTDPTETFDTDNDGVGNNADAFPSDPTETLDTDNDGVGDNADAFPNDPTETLDTDNDGVGDNADAFPNDPTETLDTDNDGVGDNADAFPSDPTETLDTDNDGVGNNADAFPSDPTETLDTDSDGVGDNADAFPSDPTETLDTDNDGVGDNADAFPSDPTETLDTDNDGVGNNADAFPNDPTETLDTDNDGVGDNADAFPSDPTETLDTDNDGVGDNADAFPSDPTETLDTDNDGVGDNADAFPSDPTETLDTDNDGVGDNADAFPNDPTETLDTDNDGIGNNADNDDDGDGVIDINDPNPLDPNESDTQAPVVSNVENMTFEATGEVTQVQLPQPTVTDDNDASPVLTVDTDDLSFSLGEHTITWTATDISGNQSSAEQVITIVDTTAPSFDDLIDMSINAQGRLTNIANLVSILATDLVDGEVAGNITSDTLLTSGRHSVEIAATDGSGNLAVSSFNLDILPKLSLPSRRPVEAGGSYHVNLSLSGEAASYPVQVSYSLLVNGAINSQLQAAIEAEQTGQLSVVIPEDVSSDDQLQLQLDFGVNAFVGEANTTELILIDRNLAPRMNLVMHQNDQPISVVDASNGIVTLTANVRDVNQNDTHNLTWSSSDGLIDTDIDDNPMTFEIDPSVLQPGIYRVNAIATETNTTDVFTVTRSAQLVIANLPPLSSDTDSDGDGIFDSEEGYGDSDGDGIADYLDNDANITRLPTQRDAAPAHTEDGLSMTLGLFVSRLGITAASAGFAIEDLAALLQAGDADPTDDHFDSITPVYNFIINGLSQQGDSVAVVIPLAAGQTLPADAVYRKYNPSLGWYSFVVDASNGISSALVDENGNCPLVNDDVYSQHSSQGLIAGNHCIRLLIEDGGPNDIDGIANGAIEDPGVVTVQTGTPPENIAPTLVLENHNSNVEENSSMTLTAVGSDENDDTLTYQWQQLSGPAVVLENQTSNQLTLTTPEVSNDAVIEIQVTVSDGELSYSVTTSLTITNNNTTDTEEPAPGETNSSSGGAFSIWLMLMMLIRLGYRSCNRRR
ncbi:HYR domain-containing protein [Shewanella sp. Scap07]|uniref:PKD domain-containing protein n=1 Tax=Shewanella sp. Scap07 TaxID=2589987 RepID=UPI0015BE0480|nr:choice-of-anchor U domain-containing protein [Shewanella sp. Scap07]QLE86630.1 HYR domain-containing protein [Shewanella sp. Scap07]